MGEKAGSRLEVRGYLQRQWDHTATPWGLRDKHTGRLHHHLHQQGAQVAGLLVRGILALDHREKGLAQLAGHSVRNRMIFMRMPCSCSTPFLSTQRKGQNRVNLISFTFYYSLGISARDKHRNTEGFPQHHWGRR